jgi:hypothetical protein
MASRAATPAFPLSEGTIVVLLATLLAVLKTYPLAVRLASVGRLDSGDGAFAVWNVAWVARTLVLAPSRVFDANIFHPHPNTLAYSEANLGAGILAIPAYWLSGSALAAHNVVVIASFALSQVATYYLVRYLTASRPAAVAAAIAFSFCPYVFSHLPHIQLLMTAGLPAVLLAFHRWVDAPTPGRAAVLGIALFAQAIACAYYGIFAGLIVGCGVLFYAVSRGHWRRGAFWLGAFGAAALSLVLVAPLFGPFLEIRDAGFTRTLEDAGRWSADWKSYLASPAWTHRWMHPLLGRWSEVLFPGFLPVALALAGLGLAIAGSQPAARSSTARPRETAGFYGLVGFTALWASFGPEAGLYRLLFHTLPIFSFLRAPSRLGIVVTLAVAVLLALAVERLVRGRPRHIRLRWGVAIAALLALELTVAPIRFPPAGPPPAAHRLLATLPPGPVAEFPFYALPTDLWQQARYMYLSTFHWHPLVNGYSDHFPPGYRRAAVTIARFPQPEAYAVLRRYGVRYLVFHLARYEREHRRRLVSALDAARAAGHLLPLAHQRDVLLFEVVTWPEPVTPLPVDR